NEPLKEARNLLLHQWIDVYPHNVDKKLDFNLELGMRHPRDLPFKAPHFVSRLLQEGKAGRIETTIDLGVQKTFEERIKSYISVKKKIGLKNAAALIVDTNTMEALAYLGSVDFYNNKISGQVDGVRARRSPGSALKPFAYALGIEQGNFHPQTMIKDAPAPFGTYTPDNFDRVFAGPLSATEALIYSRNIPALHVAQDLSNPSLHEFLLRAGIPMNEDPKHYGLSIVLGTAEVTMEELIELYSNFNNEGLKKPIRYEATDPISEGEKFLSSETAFLTLDMLSQNPTPEDTNDEKWRINPRSVAWKTGTSVGFRDAWAVGVFDHYAIAVWVGHFSGKGNPAFVGRHASGPLMFSLIEAFSKLRELDFPDPAPTAKMNIEEVEFCAISGHLPNEHCPHRKKGWFIPGVSPISTCQVHRQIEIDLVSGKQSCPKLEGKKEKKVFEYWTTDLLKLFKQAGIGRKLPPTLHASCEGENHGEVGPQILSPKKEIVYHLRSRGSDSKQIPLLAIADGNVKKLSWYINNELVGVSDVSDPLVWKAKTGRHTAKAIDEQGRMAEVSFDVQWID
ncbi:MAG: penicillin-binding protein 1C, partial [Bdellovibrionales bacterium]|nr:penicillin-binding protein 1C [Bdellovibrionales bacterium]NQZ19506.1 penicillin-binding protein 1C [Bdellovibrionales bacterium]